MDLDLLTAITALDGRYRSKLGSLDEFTSEFGLLKYRTIVEIRWFKHLSNTAQITQLPKLSPEDSLALDKHCEQFSLEDARQIKKIEQVTNHDVKAVEYFVKDLLSERPCLAPHLEFVHFACTSEDINNLAYALMLNDSRAKVVLPIIEELIANLTELALRFKSIPMLARTHGQTASPTTVGKELANFLYRLKRQKSQVEQCSIMAKFNGAVGNFNAHTVAYPELDWPSISTGFIESLGLDINPMTTQIEPHDYIAEYFHSLIRFNQIMIDFNRDIWTYISQGYFSQRKVEGETGSSTMPHKVNPIDFENSEGNLGIANALMSHMADKLMISRLQRDLSDSTVLRNLGSCLGHSILAYNATLKGLSKLELDPERLNDDLNLSWEVLSEAVQTVMRKHGIKEPYEKLKSITRGKQLDKRLYLEILQELDLPAQAVTQLQQLSPATYIGLAAKLTEQNL
ncbi:MAG: adenylosuccinate lyase [Pseudomonadales bacterium]|nr:adenylosuccinate lyase [Pseudomonadales bacterium]